MAVLKERLNRKNASGGYDTIYLETSSDIVIRPDGTTVETTLTTIKNDLTQVQNDLADVGGDIQQQVTTIITGGKAKHASTHARGGSDPITPGAIGALSSGGTAEAARKLAISRMIQTNLGSTSATRFNGTTDVSPGVTGVLGLGNGGTGKTTAPLSLYALINGSTAITGASLADTDVIGVGDVSAATGKKITIAELKSIMGGGSGVAPDGSIPYVGAQYMMFGRIWRCVHVDSSYYYLMSEEIVSQTKFGSNNVYAGSTLAKVANTFGNTMGINSDNRFAAIMVNGVSQKVQVASYEQMKGGFDYFTSDGDRIAYYKGSSQSYWTSSPSRDDRVDCVKNGGFTDYGPSYTCGFRPFVALRK